MSNVRRGLLIAEFIFFLGFLGLAVPNPGIWGYLQLACFLIWALLLLVHIFWFNRKSVFSYFSSRPRVSRKGVRQILAFILAACMIGLVAMSMPVLNVGIALPGTVTVWLPLILAVVILGHIWINRRPFFYYLGKRTGLAAWGFGWLLLCLGIAIRLG